ncbi:carboxymuconolactone decarboxylase family protein [Allorhodopirellula solitaria]|uniref:Carboxymuconolactone decarboxylase family protein n=1 Tax=Allorhodopirellula solitaria TaxID=2527987 RepID=A0A5C5YEA1_9BACT|nr:carboxymuconolactone decarboxylase family protein [Allorhodopirellula solitaria]TWT74077.1 Carboxymuconolactone decarboxylase family protein [Allorhodopirellula solitaria]
MPYVPPLKQDAAPEKSQPILKAVEEKFGQALNLFSTLAHQPDVLGGTTQINDGIQNDLPDVLREFAYYKASTVNDCKYCSHYHKGAAKKAGATPTQLSAIDDFADSDAFTDEEKAVLSYAEELTKTANVSPDTVARLKLYLDDTQLVTLAATVALANFTNRVNHGLDIELP